MPGCLVAPVLGSGSQGVVGRWQRGCTAGCACGMCLTARLPSCAAWDVHSIMLRADKASAEKGHPLRLQKEPLRTRASSALTKRASAANGPVSPRSTGLCLFQRSVDSRWMPAPEILQTLDTDDLTDLAKSGAHKLRGLTRSPDRPGKRRRAWPAAAAPRAPVSKGRAQRSRAGCRGGCCSFAPEALPADGERRGRGDGHACFAPGGPRGCAFCGGIPGVRTGRRCGALTSAIQSPNQSDSLPSEPPPRRPKERSRAVCRPHHTLDVGSAHSLTSGIGRRITRRRPVGGQPAAPRRSAMGDTEGEVVKVGRRVYVGNLAWRTSWQELKDKFRENGNVVYANVMTNDDGAGGRDAAPSSLKPHPRRRGVEANASSSRREAPECDKRRHARCRASGRQGGVAMC
eukprot:339352-Chlamydomonas_euryale.AAC.3